MDDTEAKDENLNVNRFTNIQKESYRIDLNLLCAFK